VKRSQLLRLWIHEQLLTAIVQNEPTNKGVTWGLAAARLEPSASVTPD
jgi:hypothetical protein